MVRNSIAYSLILAMLLSSAQGAVRQIAAIDTGASASSRETLVQVAAGFEHGLALKPDGTVWGWGANRYYQVGFGAYKIETPSLVVIDSVIGIAAGYHHSLAIKNDRSVWIWGDTVFSDQFVRIPQRIEGLPDIVQAVAGLDFSLFLSADGRVWGVGANGAGELGVGLEIPWTTSPVCIPTLSGIVAISAGPSHAMALDKQGRVWAWGFNFFGQTGSAAVKEVVAYPKQVKGLPKITAIATGLGHSMALDAKGGVWTWGSNKYGQLGHPFLDGFTFVPRRVALLSNCKEISAGGGHSLALNRSGHVWGWGDNEYGQAGAGRVDNMPSIPARIAGLSGIVSVSAGGCYSLALGADSSLYAWGDNFEHQLARPSQIEHSYRPLPIAIPPSPAKTTPRLLYPNDEPVIALARQSLEILYTDVPGPVTRIDLYDGDRFHSLIYDECPNFVWEQIHSCPWRIPEGVTGTNFRVRISSYIYPNLHKTSDHPISIHDPEILSPKSRSVLRVGETADIVWQGFPGSRVTIELIHYDGTRLPVGPAAGVPNNDLYRWSIPLDLAIAEDEGFQLVMRDADRPNDILAYSPVFSIVKPGVPRVQYPSDPGILWKYGDRCAIAWSDLPGAFVQIVLHPYMSEGIVIAEATPNDGYFEWDVPMGTLVNGFYQIEVRSIEYPDVLDWSDNFFTLVSRPPTVATSDIQTKTYKIGGSCYKYDEGGIVFKWKDFPTGMIRFYLWHPYAPSVEIGTHPNHAGKDGGKHWCIPTDAGIAPGTGYYIRVEYMAFPDEVYALSEPLTLLLKTEE